MVGSKCKSEETVICHGFSHRFHTDWSLYLHLKWFAWISGDFLVNDIDEFVNMFVDKSGIFELGCLKVWSEEKPLTPSLHQSAGHQAKANTISTLIYLAMRRWVFQVSPSALKIPEPKNSWKMAADSGPIRHDKVCLVDHGCPVRCFTKIGWRDGITFLIVGLVLSQNVLYA
jgi:hypothetical protein